MLAKYASRLLTNMGRTKSMISMWVISGTFQKARHTLYRVIPSNAHKVIYIAYFTRAR